MSLVLPDLIDIDINKYTEELENLYRIYLDELYIPQIEVLGKPITCRQIPEDAGKHECFWHLITEGDPERTPDFNRIRRLHWCAYILLHYTDREIVCWEKECTTHKGKQRRIFFWLPNEKYYVILGENRAKTSFELITAYCVSYYGTLRCIRRDMSSCPDPRF